LVLQVLDQLAAGGNETILVVEDDAMVRNFVAAQLQALGYKTITADDGPAALAITDSGQPFDLLFTDVILPGGMTGRQLADEAAKRRPGVKVLYTSGYTDCAIVHQGRLDAGVLLLTKPYRMSDFDLVPASTFSGWRSISAPPAGCASRSGRRRMPGHEQVASTTPPSVKASATICVKPSGSCSAKADATTPITGTAMVPIAATEASSRASAANQLT
jgi:CheY-like chemotaxis protein